MAWVKVDGKDQGDVILYALSTCGWCKKTRALLDELGVAYQYRYVDLESGAERESTLDEVRKWNPQCSFPTIVINGKECIMGFQPDKIKGALGL